MATVEVSTWAQLRNAIINAANGDTIKLIADIDCNDEIPEGVNSTIKPSSWTIETLTITGEYTEDGVTKNHVIRNLRNSSVPIFKFSVGSSSTYIYIRRIDFLNLILSAPLLEHYNSNNSSAHLYVMDCRFTGRRTSNVINVTRTGNYWTTLDVHRSYFNIPYYGSTVSNLPLFNLYSAGANVGGYMYNCRIRETFTGTYTPSSTDGDTTCSVFNMHLSGCRVEGDVVSGKYPRYHSDSVISGYTPSAQNVYDVEFKLTNNTDTSVPLYAIKGVVKVPVRKKDAETTTYEISSASTGVIQATESQMQDTDELIRLGFDIIPSNQG